MTTLIESLRRTSVERLFGIDAFVDVWNSGWKNLVAHKLGNNYSATDLLDLGDDLSSIFFSSRASGARGGANSQAGATRAGVVWESLICWYINLCMVGTRVVAFRKKSQVATPFRDALTINYGTTSTNSESDIIVLIFPNHPDFTSALTNRQIINASGQQINLFNSSGLVQSKLTSAFDSLSAQHFSDFGLSVIQCKTNWNENAQIPMLWDLVYSARTFMPGSAISIGINNHHLSNLNRFNYSFVTAPTNALNKFHSGKMEIKRVANLSGGNYWGFPSRSGVAFSIKEIFNRNFSTGFTNLRTVLSGEISKLSSVYKYFDI